MICQKAAMPKFKIVNNGIKRTQAFQESNTRVWLPITPHILRQIRQQWSGKAEDPDVIMLWAACCLTYFGFFRMGEIAVPDDTPYDPAVHLSPGDIAVDSRLHPSMLQVRLKRSKTDQEGKGVDVFVGKTNNNLCPVAQHWLIWPLEEGHMDLCSDLLMEDH